MDAHDPRYFMIDSVESLSDFDEFVPSAKNSAFSNSAGSMDIDGMISLGERIYGLIEKGRPVSSSKGGSASCVRSGFGLFDLYGGMLKTKRDRIEIKNVLGQVVFSFGVRIEAYVQTKVPGDESFYIRDASVNVEELTCGWMYECNASVAKTVIANVSPVSDINNCQISLTVEYSLGSVLKHGTFSNTYIVNSAAGMIYAV
ncbi:hypothetical protein PCE1_000318 [Barthelona sp. PCE]